MFGLMLAAAAEIAGVQFGGDCAAAQKLVRVETGEATSVQFDGWELALAGPDESGSLACQVTLALAPPPGFRVGVNGVHVRGAVVDGADSAWDLTARGGAPGTASTGQLKSLAAVGAFDVALGAPTLWSDCGEAAPSYSVSLDVSGFHAAGAATPARVRIDAVSIGAIVYRRCPDADPQP